MQEKLQINLLFSKNSCIFACFFGKLPLIGVPDTTNWGPQRNKGSPTQANAVLAVGRAEARVAFMPPIGIRCDRVAEREGKLAEWSIAAVLKTVDLRGSGGSNPSLSAKGKTICLSEFTQASKSLFSFAQDAIGRL